MIFDKKGYTKYELVSVIIIIAVIIAILIPVWLTFLEGQRRNLDGLAAERAEDTAQMEFMLSHYDSGDAIVYMFTGDTEVLHVYRHWSLGDTAYSDITPPRTDGFSDGGAVSGKPKRAKSKKVGGKELFVVVRGDGEVVYNSWRS